jgi:hypothetical protein
LPVAKLVLPAIKPKAYLPVHWDRFFDPFQGGVTKPYADPPLDAFLAEAHVQRLAPLQYMDKWRLDRAGIRPLGNDRVKRTLGFAAPAPVPR